MRDGTPLVLLVDDYADARELFAEFLGMSGYRVQEARDGAEALEHAGALLPNVILMDLSLPVLDGWEATRQLKEDPRTRHIPVVAMTGHPLEGAAAAGFAGVVGKPCAPEVLLAAVRRALAAVS